EARAAYEESVRLDGQQAETYAGLGDCYYEQNRVLDAIACYQKAVRLRPDFAEAHYHCALARLSQTDYLNGWRDLEWRWKCPEFAGRLDGPPLWNGAAIEGRRLLVRSEGLPDDTLQFARYVPLLGQQGGEVFFEVPSVLMPLLAESGFENLVAAGEPPTAYDLQIPLWSLPRVLGTTWENVPGGVPYLAVPPERERLWSQRLTPLAGFKVGICWQSGPAGDVARSIPLPEFAPLAAISGVQLVSLQDQDTREQLTQDHSPPKIADLADQFSEPRGALVDIAALIKNLDLVVTCDSAVAHLAAALGVRVWVVLSAVPQWRWTNSRDASPWYPTLRLFRQPQPGDWAGAMTRVSHALLELLTADSAGRGGMPGQPGGE
ncbi:MAG TPA: tetratricopeptide repeat protein, partial [Pirellulales bacterium]|nr:tetratricopeptide repeat protein [Pirellulales bacterium]